MGAGGFGLTDWVIVAVLAICAVQAARRGIFVEAFSLGGLIAGIGIASWNYTRLLPWFSGWLRQRALAEAAAFLCIVVAVTVLAGLAGRLIRSLVRTVGLGWADRLLGATFGLLKGGVVVTLGVAVLLAFWPGSSTLEASRLGPYFVTAAKESAVGSPEGWREKVRFGARLLHERFGERASGLWVR